VNVIASAFLLAAVLANTAIAQPLRIAYRVAMPEPASHLYDVSIDIGGVRGDTLPLQLPVWSPGRYARMDFARTIRSHLWTGARDAGHQSARFLYRCRMVARAMAGGDYRVAGGVDSVRGGSRLVHVCLHAVGVESTGDGGDRRNAGGGGRDDERGGVSTRPSGVEAWKPAAHGGHFCGRILALLVVVCAPDPVARARCARRVDLAA